MIRASFIVAALLPLLLAAACSEPAKPINGRAAPSLKLPMQMGQSASTLQQSFEQLGLTGTSVHMIEDLLVLVVDNAAYEPHVLADTDHGLSAADAMATPGVHIIIGSGFVSELKSLQPVGLLQVEGRVLSEVQPHGYTRILGLTERGFGVVHRSQYERGLFVSALQAGPGIVERGQLDISEKDLERPKYFRSFIATCDERTMLGISLKPLNLRTVGSTLIDYLETVDLQCDEVVNLAGDREAILAAKSPVDNTLVYHGHPNTHKVSLVGFKSR